jgi:hypothetical protein
MILGADRLILRFLPLLPALSRGRDLSKWVRYPWSRVLICLWDAARGDFRQDAQPVAPLPYSCGQQLIVLDRRYVFGQHIAWDGRASFSVGFPMDYLS